MNGEPTIDRREQYTMSLAFLHPPTTITNMHEAPEENHSPGASFVLDEPNSFLISYYTMPHDKKKGRLWQRDAGNLSLYPPAAP